MANLGKALKLVSTLIMQQKWIFSFEEDAEKEGKDEEEATKEGEPQANTLDDDDEEGTQPFHEAETSVYVLAPDSITENGEVQAPQGQSEK